MADQQPYLVLIENIFCTTWKLENCTFAWNTLLGYIVQNGRSAAIFTAISHWISWISSNRAKFNHISQNLIISHWISPNVPNLTKYHWILQNLTISHWISLNLTKTHHICHRISPNLANSLEMPPSHQISESDKNLTISHQISTNLTTSHQLYQSHWILLNHTKSH